MSPAATTAMKTGSEFPGPHSCARGSLKWPPTSAPSTPTTWCGRIFDCCCVCQRIACVDCPWDMVELHQGPTSLCLFGHCSHACVLKLLLIGSSLKQHRTQQLAALHSCLTCSTVVNLTCDPMLSTHNVTEVLGKAARESSCRQQGTNSLNCDVLAEEIVNLS